MKIFSQVFKPQAGHKQKSKYCKSPPFVGKKVFRSWSCLSQTLIIMKHVVLGTLRHTLYLRVLLSHNVFLRNADRTWNQCCCLSVFSRLPHCFQGMLLLAFQDFANQVRWSVDYAAECAKWNVPPGKYVSPAAGEFLSGRPEVSYYVSLSQGEY